MSEPNQYYTEEQHKIISATSPVMIRMADIYKSSYFLNAAWLRFTGGSLSLESGKGWMNHLHPDDFFHFHNVHDAAFDERKECQIKFRLKRFDGIYRWMVNTCIPHYAADGSFGGYTYYCMDINELVESEKTDRHLQNGQMLEDHQQLNEELATLNEELSAANEELVAMNEELQDAQDSLITLNSGLEDKVIARTIALQQSEEETQALNEELSAINEELAATNEELLTSNEDLMKSEANLHKAFNELKLVKSDIEKSEKLFRTIASNIPGSLITVIDRAHNILAVEGELLNKPDNDLRGKHLSALITAERYETSKELCDRVIAGENFTIEQKTENEKNYLVHFVPLKNEEENVYAGLIITLDITQIKDAEKNSAMLAAIIEHSNDAIISKTLNGIITSWNISAQRTFGYTAEEIIGQPILTLIPDDRKDEEASILARLRKGERVEHFETKRITKDKRIIDLSLTISPVMDKAGNIIGLSKIARDISEKKKDEQRKSDFIGMVSHELKTPLTSLTLMLQMLDSKLHKIEDPFVIETIGKSGLQVKKMINLINGFLNISRLESSRIQIEKQEFDMAKLIYETVEEAILTTSNHKIKVSRFDEILVHADRNKIGSVISNFLGNAIKYAPKGRDIVIDCQTKENRVVVSVKDSGIGIRKEDLGKIFERYYRVEGNYTQFISGFGIGLYLCKEIITGHGGDIWAESDFGSGSTFYFSLPVL